MDNRFAAWKPYLPVILVIAFGLFLFIELHAFIDAFLGSIILYLLLRPMMRFLVNKHHWKKGLAATCLMLGSFLVVLLPIIGISYLFISKLTVMFGESSFMTQTLNTIDDNIKQLTGFELLTKENIISLQSKAGGFISGVFGASLNILADMGIMYFVLYYMLINTGKLEEWFNENLPISRHNVTALSDELKAQTFSNAIGAPLLALIQGVFAWIGYMIFGLGDPFFWGMMTGFFSFLPLIGSTLIWLPAGLYQLTAGSTWQGVGIILYGLLVIGTVDNIFRFVFQKQFANVHPIITVFGVIIGLQMFGVPGIIFGPVILSWFIILIKIYRKDFFHLNS